LDICSEKGELRKRRAQKKGSPEKGEPRKRRNAVTEKREKR
jgi:hypothetical protein